MSELYLYLAFFIITLTVSFYLNGYINKLFIGNKLTDPVNERSSHKFPATRSGGLSIFFFYLCFLCVWYFYRAAYNSFICFIKCVFFNTHRFCRWPNWGSLQRKNIFTTFRCFANDKCGLHYWFFSWNFLYLRIALLGWNNCFSFCFCCCG